MTMKNMMVFSNVGCLRMRCSFSRQRAKQVLFERSGSHRNSRVAVRMSDLSRKSSLRAKSSSASPHAASTCLSPHAAVSTPAALSAGSCSTYVRTTSGLIVMARNVSRASPRSTSEPCGVSTKLILKHASLETGPNSKKSSQRVPALSTGFPDVLESSTTMAALS